MTANRHREIVVEFEKVQLIRKRAATDIHRCDECNADTDFVVKTVAAQIFGIMEEELTDFLKNHAVHTQEFRQNMPMICVMSLLEMMKAEQKLKHIGKLSDAA